MPVAGSATSFYLSGRTSQASMGECDTSTKSEGDATEYNTRHDSNEVSNQVFERCELKRMMTAQTIT